MYIWLYSESNGNNIPMVKIENIVKKEMSWTKWTACKQSIKQQKWLQKWEYNEKTRMR